MPELSMDFLADFVEIAAELAGDDGRALAENIGQNLGLAVRPARNKLEEIGYSQKRRSQVVADANMALTPQREKALQMSFDTHLRSIMRKGIAYSSQKMKAEKYFVVGGEPSTPPVVMSTKEYAEGNWPQLGPPNDARVAVPVPKGYESVAGIAADVWALPPKQRDKLIEQALLKKSGAR